MPALTISLKLPTNATTAITRDIQRTICAAIDRENQNTLAHAATTHMSAATPTTLATRTGRLKNSLATTPATIAPDGTITTTLTADTPYAQAHEYGFTGSVTVRTHSRRFKTYKSRHITTNTHHYCSCSSPTLSTLHSLHAI